eukprot:m.153038 g.153038  ORF g.153038 m.153038 type:complete len:396 (+) comp15063_c0_seq2:2535-3722(+)
MAGAFSLNQIVLLGSGIESQNTWTNVNKIRHSQMIFLGIQGENHLYCCVPVDAANDTKAVLHSWSWGLDTSYPPTHSTDDILQGTVRSISAVNLEANRSPVVILGTCEGCVYLSTQQHNIHKKRQKTTSRPRARFRSEKCLETPNTVMKGEQFQSDLGSVCAVFGITRKDIGLQLITFSEKKETVMLTVSETTSSFLEKGQTWSSTFVKNLKSPIAWETKILLSNRDTVGSSASTYLAPKLISDLISCGLIPDHDRFYDKEEICSVDILLVALENGSLVCRAVVPWSLTSVIYKHGERIVNIFPLKLPKQGNSGDTADCNEGLLIIGACGKISHLTFSKRSQLATVEHLMGLTLISACKLDDSRILCCSDETTNNVPIDNEYSTYDNTDVVNRYT